jgi:hypothetical protein
MLIMFVVAAASRPVVAASTTRGKGRNRERPASWLAGRAAREDSKEGPAQRPGSKKQQARAATRGTRLCCRPRRNADALERNPGGNPEG